MGDVSSERIDEIVDCINQDNDGEISLVELLSLAKHMVASLQTIVDEQDGDLGTEVNAIARHIEKTQIELGALSPGALTFDSIPKADEDLREVVASTETATQSILDSAETIMSADPDDLEDYRQTVDSAVMSIFEACCFQDMTGQRISRVAETLGFISEHITYVTDVINGQGGAHLKRPERADNPLMHGPQSFKDAISQDLADNLFETGEASNVIRIKT